MTLAAVGSQVLDAVRKVSSAVQAEAYAVTSESRAQEWSEGKPENQSSSRSQGIGLRVIDQGKLGFSSTNRTDGEAMGWLARTAVEASRVTAPDAHLELPKPVSVGQSGDLELVDPVLSGGSFEERSGFLASIENKVKARDKRLAKVLRASYREGRYETAIVSTTGVSAPSAGTSVSFSLACVAVQDAETQVGYGFQAVRHANDLKIDWVIDKTVEYTLALLGGKQVPSGRYDLVLDPLVGAEMLELAATALRADQVNKGRSFFASKVGQLVGAPSLTIVDDGRLVRGLGTSAYDAEGMPTQTTELVKDGVLLGYLFDSASARRMKQRSTGNAGRSSYKGLPEPESTNFFVRPGTRTPEDLIAGIDSGLYVRNVMGLHTVDTVSGEYSLGIMGERIEMGKRTHGVRGVTIAGNLLDLLKDVEAVGNDLTFMGSVGAPTLWIRGVSVGGS
jgi:PmbA protein